MIDVWSLDGEYNSRKCLDEAVGSNLSLMATISALKLNCILSIVVNVSKIFMKISINVY